MKFKIKKILKRLFIISTIGILLIVGIIVYTNWRIPNATKNYVFDNLDSIPKQKAALVLGTSPNFRGGSNPYFTYRIQATTELYKAGKMDKIIVSGDNRHRSYNEPRYMMQALIKAGVPDSIIHFDFAGFRTLDSVVRMYEIFGQSQFIIVSQKFHNERAVFLAQHYGLKAYGYNAKDLDLNRSSIKTKVREVFARVKVYVDIIIGKQPKFLGDPINIDKPNPHFKEVIKEDSLDILNIK